MSIFRNIWEWIKSEVVGEVPSADALCEYDCRKPQCMEGEWENCQRRLSRAAGELMPAARPVPPAAPPDSTAVLIASNATENRASIPDQAADSIEKLTSPSDVGRGTP